MPWFLFMLFVLFCFLSRVEKGFTKKTTSMMCCMHCNSHQDNCCCFCVGKNGENQQIVLMIVRSAEPLVGKNAGNDTSEIDQFLCSFGFFCNCYFFLNLLIQRELKVMHPYAGEHSGQLIFCLLIVYVLYVPFLWNISLSFFEFGKNVTWTWARTGYILAVKRQRSSISCLPFSCESLHLAQKSS